MNNEKMIRLGDRHNGAFTALVSDNGKNYIFKPRNALTENAWSAFLGCLREIGFEYLPACVTVLSENGESHTEAVAEYLPTDENGVENYYRRIGSLILLSYLLGSTDLHTENLIANGEYPVLVDLETLLSGYKTADDGTVKISIFSSHLMPQFSGCEDISGISGDNEKNIPFTENGKAEIYKYISQIKEEFVNAGNIILNNKNEVCGMLELFSDCEFRILLRPTRVYAYVIEKVTESENPRQTAEKLLSRAYLRDVDSDRINKAAEMLRCEIESVLNGDIPLFYTKGDGTTLFCAGKAVMKDFLRLSPVASAKQRVKEFTEDEKNKEAEMLALALASKKPLAKVRPGGGNAFEAVIKETERCYFENRPSKFLSLIQSGNDSFYGFCGYGLYNGCSGIMCMYAAILPKTGSKFLLDRLNGYFDEIEKEIAFIDFKSSVSDSSCNLAEGLGGIISSLLHIYDLTGEKRAFDDAVLLAEKLDFSNVSVKKYDLLSGISGICLSLPKLPENIAVPIARALLPVLLKYEPELTGAGHGAAGVALALGALQSVLKTCEADEKIISLLRWENENYDETENNWLDLRKSEKAFMHGWCSGAPGIGMCRSKLAEYSENPEILKICRDDIEKVKKFFETPSKLHRATLCCGRASNIMAASRLGIELDIDLSDALCADSPALYHPLNTADLNPSLMQGLAGVGYALALKGDKRSGGMLL